MDVQKTLIGIGTFILGIAGIMAFSMISSIT